MAKPAPRLVHAAGTHPGLVRQGNEDLFICNPREGIYAVIDGVGGEEGGEEAARIASGILQSRLAHPTATVRQRLREAITLANNEIFKVARATPARSRMSCVLTVVVVDGDRLVVGHVGDSRLYLLRRGEISQLTIDHSPVGELERRGALSEIEAMRHPRRSEIFRDVGSEEHHFDDEGFVDLYEVPLAAEGAFLLCSDGLSDQVPQAAVLKAVEDHAGDPEAAVAKLIAAANEAGGKDNVTVVLVEGEGFAPPAAAAVRKAAARGAGYARAGRTGSLAELLRGRLVRGLAALIGLLLLAYLGFKVPAILDALQGGEMPVRMAQPPAVLNVGPGRPHATISAALAAAKAGDTVLVEPGIYPETLALKSGVRLVSRASRQAVLRPAAGAHRAVLALGVRGAQLEGFAIRAEGAAAFDLGVELNDAEVELIDLEITGAKGFAVEITGLGSSSLRRCLLRGNAGGAVRITSPVTQTLEGNLFRNNGSATAPVVELAAGSFPRLADNDFAGNAGLPIRGLAADAVEETFARNRFGALSVQRAIEVRGAAP